MTQRNPSMRLLLALGLVALLPTNLMAAPFTPGNIVVERVGDGVVDIGDLFNVDRMNAFPVHLDEYTPAGALVQSIALPTTVDGSQRRLTESGGTTGDGKLTRSTNGAYLIIPGYDAALGTPNVVQTQAAAVNRTIGRVSWDGTIDTSTALTDAFNGVQFRGVASNDGNQFWMIGQNDSILGTGGFRYVANLGDTTSVSLNGGPLPASNNNQGVNVFDNGGTEQLYLMSRADFPGRGVHKVGDGLPTSGSPELTLLTPPLETERNNGFSFAMIDLNAGLPGLDTIYMAFDDMDGGVSKFSLNDMGSWDFSGHIDNGEVFNTRERSMQSLTAKRVGDDVILYVVTAEREANRIQTFTDTTGPGGDITGSGVFTTVATTGDNYVLRGLAFAPENPAASVPGDTDGDGDVDADDFNKVAVNFHMNVAGGASDGDFNNDGIVNLDDYSILAINFGVGVPEASHALPEPATVALLALGGLAVMGRHDRRRPAAR